jgi:acyl carrier protein
VNDLHNEIKQMIIDSLELEDIELDDIDSHEPLFVDGLGLDSIDALEIGLALQKRYGIKLKADSEETRQHFASVNALASLVEEKRTK